MTSQSDHFNRIASDKYNTERIEQKIKAPRTPTETWLAKTEWLELPQTRSILFSVKFTVAEMAERIEQRQLDAINSDELSALIDEIDALSNEDAKARLGGGE